MKLNDLSPAAGSVKPNFRKGRGIGSGNGNTARAEDRVPETEKQQARVTRDRTHAPAAVSDPDLKAARCPSAEDFL